MLVELQGKKSACGVNELLGGDEPGTFRSMLQPMGEPRQEPPDDELEHRLDRLAATIAALEIEVTTSKRDAGWQLDLLLREPAFLPNDLDVRVAPLAATTTPHPLNLEESPVARLEGLADHEVSELFRIELTITEPRARRAFVVRWPLIGDRPDPVRALLARLVTDRERLIAFLRLLLGANEAMPLTSPTDGAASHAVGSWEAAFAQGTPPLELLLRTVVDHPERLDSLARLIPELADAAGGTIQSELLAIWEPIWATRQGQDR
jgi:hypothetical protein